MKIKELQKSVNVAWSPVQHPSILLAAGTAAQQMDLASTSSVLELYDANLADAGYDLVLRGSQPSQYRFHKLVWSPLGIDGAHSDGVIVAGCESGHLQVYDAGRLLAGQDACMATQCKHSGAVRALDINPFQTNLLASGSAESEILIWDLNSTGTPMMPGTNTQPPEDVQALGWNRQVQHILASVFSARCVVWDLRKNESVIKLSDSQSRVRWRALQWHPEVATQLWLASEDDQAPVVQLWDLRYATAPTRTVAVHQRGVLGLSWCPKDSGLMVSCGKDSRIVCWDPAEQQSGAEVLSEVAASLHWYSDVQFCPRNPALLSAASLDGAVSLYSLYGGQAQQVQTSNKIADSFPGMDAAAAAPPTQAQPVAYEDLRRAPKWLRRPVGARFGFGGKVITFNATTKSVSVGQVVSEPELVRRSDKLSDVLASGNAPDFGEYCKTKADQMQTQHGRYVWYFLKANFEANPRDEMLNLLGYNAEDMKAKFTRFIPKNLDDSNNTVDELATNLAALSRNTTTDPFDAIAAEQSDRPSVAGDSEIPYKIPTGDDTESLIGQALLTGRREDAVDLCLANGRHADAIIIAMTGGSELLARTQCRYLQRQRGYLANIISALVTDDWSGVVEQCTTDSWREALAATLTHSVEQMPALCERLGERLRTEGDVRADALESAILCYICAGNVDKLVDAWPRVESAIGDLQELVEIVMMLQKALELQGRSNAAGASGKLAELLTQYAGLLAAQGSLDAALGYLGPSEDAQLVDLRERLYHSLGHKQAYAPAHRQTQPQQQQQPANRYGQQTRGSFSRTSASSQPAAAYPGAPVPAVPSWQPPAAAAALPPQPANQWNTAPLQPNANVPSNAWNPQPPMQAQPPPISGQQQPPRPPSAGGRSKYLRDPSVQNGSTPYNATPNPYAPPSFNNNFIQPGAPATGVYPGAPAYQPTAAFNNNPMVPAPVPAAPSVFTPFQPAPAVPNVAPGHDYGATPVELARPAIPAKTPPPGWNDPPALKSTRKPVIRPTTQSFDYGRNTATPGSVSAQDGIAPTLPPSGLYNPNAHQPAHAAGPAAYQPFQPQQPMPGYPPHNNNAAGQFQPAPPSQQLYQPTQPFNPTAPAASSYSNNQFGQPLAAPVHRQPTPEPPRPKAALPEEYVYMQTVFNELKTQCSNAAANAQLKRKLDDVAKRLEALYDLLRDDRLSSITLTPLNQLVQLVQTGDYGNALAIHTQMVSGPDFAQIASFMPGIKTLLQIAQQLQVFLR